MAVTYAPTPKHFQGPEPWAGGCRGALADDPAPRVTLELQTPPGGQRAARAGSPSWRNRWRRRQDSNLRALAGQWFSRPPPSASRPLLHGLNRHLTRDFTGGEALRNHRVTNHAV